MRAVDRRELEMGVRVREFELANPDLSPGSERAAADLTAYLQEADVVHAQQQDSIRRERAATARKQEIRLILNSGHLVHIARAGVAASRELPELEHTFAFRRDRKSFANFRSRARSLVAAAETHRELLERHGLSSTVMTGLTPMLDELDHAIGEGLDARRAHVGASARLAELAAAVVELVRTMDGLNQYRFRNDVARLAEWNSVSRVIDVTPRKGGTKPADGTPPPAGEMGTAA